jgi:hypothetical protein
MGMIAACVATYRPLLRILKAGPKGRDSEGYKRHLGLEDLFVNGVKTTIHANGHNNASGEEILGNDIVRMVEITVEETHKRERPESCTSEATSPL